MSLKSGIQNWAIREFWEKAHFHRTHFPGVKGEFCCHLPTKWDIFGLKSGLRLLGPLWKWGKGHKGLSALKSGNMIVLIVILVLVWSSALSGQGIFLADLADFFHQMTWFGPLNNSGGVALNFVYFSWLSIPMITKKRKYEFPDCHLGLGLIQPQGGGSCPRLPRSPLPEYLTRQK